MSFDVTNLQKTDVNFYEEETFLHISRKLQYLGVIQF